MFRLDVGYGLTFETRTPLIKRAFSQPIPAPDIHDTAGRIDSPGAVIS